MATVGAAYLLGSPGDVSEARSAGLQFRAKAFVDETGQCRAGPHLSGVEPDLNHMLAFCRRKSISIRGGMCFQRFMKNDALRGIKSLFAETVPNELYILYYTGHGGEGSGNWIFTDGAVSYNEVYDLWCQSGKCETAEL